MRRHLVLGVLLLALAGYGVHSLFIASSSPPGEASQEQTPSLVFYTSLGATTPQIPFWAAVRQGWPQGLRLETRAWKDLEDLRGVVLAGQGDLWLGHLEGLAQASLRGAPVTLLAVTGWRKFYFLSDDAGARDLPSLAALCALNGQSLAVIPPDSPALGLLEDMDKRGGPGFQVSRLAPRQLMLEVLRGQAHHLLAPEPLVSLLLLKAPQLKVVASLEEEHARLSGGPARQPFVGLAARTDWLRRHPGLARQLVEQMERQAGLLAGDAEAALAVLPPQVAEELGWQALRLSMSRDIIHVERAVQARQAVTDFLAMVMPASLGQAGAALPESFWAAP